MKKLCLLVALLMCIVLSCLAETSTTYTSGSFQYKLLEDGTAYITRYNGANNILNLPDTLDGHPVSWIGSDAFKDCKSLTTIVIPHGVTSIAMNAFRSCSNLLYVTIPDSVTSIGSGCFYGCTDLVTITIPDSVIDIGHNPFIECYQLTSIIVSPEHPVFATIDGVLFDKTDRSLVACPGSFSGTYTIPQGIQSINSGAFSHCTSLSGIVIPDSVTHIGGSSFEWCQSLTDVTIPDSVTTIGMNAFASCQSLTSVTLPSSVTSIGMWAFSYCSELSSITVPRDSYAAQYCKDNNLPYTYPDANDWLNN